MHAAYAGLQAQLRPHFTGADRAAAATQSPPADACDAEATKPGAQRSGSRELAFASGAQVMPPEVDGTRPSGHCSATGATFTP